MNIKLYLSGPISNDPAHLQVFNEAQELLESRGFKVVNPCRLDHSNAKEESDYMRTDLKALCDCQGVALLPFSAPSEGVPTELIVANSIKATVLSVEKWVELRETWGRLPGGVRVDGNSGQWRRGL